jgi:aspartate/methionine/tyrosine aminotransferase
LSSPVQWAFPGLFAQRRSLQSQLLHRIKENWSCLKSTLSVKNGYEVLDTEGGWYAVLRLVGETSDEDLAIEIMQKTSVVVHPGHFYDFPSGEYLVLSLITPVSNFKNGISALPARK